VAVPQQFKPSLTPQQVTNYRRLYDQQPDKFDDQTLEALEQHAEYYKLPFAENQESFLGKTGEVMKQAGAGFFSGFTTFNVGDPPKDDAEAIGRNIGHLAGFVGYIPSMPFKLMGAYKLAQAAKAARGTSVPMRIANFATKKAGKLTNNIYGKAIGARADAAKTAVGFLQNNVVKDMASGGFHLGVASAVSSWQGGVDEMLDSFIHGAETGAVFRGIGNLIQTGSPAADKSLRTLSASLYTGLPSTARGETTPMQIYQYLLGGYFGYNEMPVHRRMGQQHLSKMMKQGVRDPELVVGWDKIDKPGQDWVIKKVKELHEPVNALAAEIMSAVPGINAEEAQKRASEFIKSQEEKESIQFSTEGEPVRNYTEEEFREMDLSGEDVDAQIKPAQLSINAKTFVDRNMEGYLEGRPIGEKLLIAKDLNDEWTRLLKTEKSEKTGINPGEAMSKYILEKHPKFSQLEEDYSYWRGLGYMRTRQRPVNMITITNGKARIMTLDKNGLAQNDAGNKKQLSQEPKSIEKVWLEDWNRKVGGEETEAYGVYAILDHMVRSTPTGMREFDLGKYEDYLAKRNATKNHREYANDEDINAAKNEYDKEIGRLMKFMNYRKKLITYKDGTPVLDRHGKKQYYKHDMYYYGGRGDAERMYFMKYHPDVSRNKKVIKKDLAFIKATLKKAGVKEKDLKAIDKSREAFIKRYGKGIGGEDTLAGEIFDRSYISNVIYDIRLNGYKSLSDFSKVLKKGYVNNAKGFNKRAQIWLTSGYSADPEAVALHVEKARRGKKAIENDSLNIQLIEDLGDEINHVVGTASSKHYEVSDGGIIGRSDAIDGLNYGAGLPLEGGVNKSFIVSPSAQYGALLGKYMIHSASPKLEKYMHDNNIHLIIPRSAAKQIGERKVGNISWVRKKPKVDAEIYELPIRDIKIVMSEKTDKHSIESQHMPKQMFMNFTPYSFFDPSRAPFKNANQYNEAMGKIMDDMYQTLSGSRAAGEEEYNTIVKKLAENPTAYEDDIPKILNNLDKVGVHELLGAIKKPGNELFANQVYAKIQKYNRDIIEDMRADGEYTDTELKSMKDEMANYVIVHDRIQKLIPRSIAGFLHKYSRDYRMSVIRNYIVNGITRPKIGNSGSTRMRPYEIGMSKEGITADLEKRDDIFFLDEGFRELDVDVTGIGKKRKRKLGKLWDDYQVSLKKWDEKAKKYVKIKGAKRDKQLEELFRAVLVRVPMDSMSGAHALHFKGFTGIRGYGSLLHGRTMKALGGADLDGDKAFVFFGGRATDGTGEGFKKDWKDAYDWSKNEYVVESADGKPIEADNKRAINPFTGKTYHSELTVQPDKATGEDIVYDLGKNKALQYDPVSRQTASNAASEGRGQLKVAVVQSGTIRSAYAAIRAAEDSTVFVKIKVKDFTEDLTLRVRAKKGDTSLRAFRGLTRAAVGLASDPMDEAGLKFGKRGEELLEKQTDALFEYKIIDNRHMVGNKQNPNFGKPVHKYDRLIKPHHKRSAVINLMKDINQGLYSRNFAENRRFHMWEIHERLEGINDPEKGLAPEQRNTFLPKLATDIQGLDWSDGVLQRLKETNLDRLYEEHQGSLKAYDWLRDALGRETMAVPMSAYYKLAMKYKLYTKEGMESQLDKQHPRYKRDILGGDKFKYYNKNKFDKFDPDNIEQRTRHLTDIVKKAEDFIINDLSDMASIKYIVKKAKNISNSRIKEIAEQADFLKKNSYILANKAKKIDKENSSLDQYEVSFLEAAHDKIYGDKQSAALNQMQIDKRIEQYKELITPEEADLFDAFMLGTLWRGRKFDKKAFFKEHGPPRTERVAKDIENMIGDSKKTSLSRIGFASSAISDASVRNMLKEYSKLFDYTIDIPDVKTAEILVKSAEELDRPKPFFDSDGNRIEGMVVENPEKDAETQLYFDEYAPFIGLHKGELSKEASELAYRIKDHLEHYNNIVGKDLNGVMRWLIKKDINQASLEDFKTLDRWFSQTRDGSWWQKMMRPVKDKSAKISPWHHLMFPKAIGQDLMRFDLKLVEARAPYKDKYGWVHGRVVQPDNMMTKMQGAVHTMQQQSTQMYEQEKDLFDADMRPYLEGIPDGAELFRVAVRLREFKYATSPEFRKRYKADTATFNAFSKEYINKWNEIQKEYGWEALKDKIYDVPVEGGRVIKLTGNQIVTNINNIITKWNKRVHGWMTGERDMFGQNEWQRSYSSLRGKYKNYAGDYHIVEKFLKKFNEAVVKGERVDLSEGIDGLREIAKSQMIAETPKRHSAIKENINLKLEIEETGDLGPEGYWPHVAGDRKLAANGIKDLIKTLEADPFMDKRTKLKELTKAIYHYKQVTGDWMPNSEINEPYEQAFNVLREINTKQQKKGEGVSWFTSIRKVGSQHSRNAHIPGWSIEPEVYSNYMKGVIDNMHKHAAQIKVRSDIYRFAGEHHKKTGDWAHTFDWVDFFNLYAQDALGYPQKIPDRVLNNDSMKIKGTPYAWWNDSNVKRRVNDIRKKLGIGAEKEAGLPEELKGIDFGVLAKWGNLEAKYQLASLLAHPKSAVANLYGGTVHTLASTGMENYLNGRNVRYLQSNVNPEWKNLTDVQDWVYKLGVVEDFLIYEAGLNPKFKGKKWQEFFAEASGKIRKDPKLEDVELRSIAKKHGIADTIFNKAAWFMRRPERTLRRDAFMAHYLQARNNFEGAITRFDDPVLIKLAKEGVKSTQFLYSAPFRPAFARSTMGKVMTRFQLWSWNSVRFRNQVISEAALRGWKEGTEEFERFKRLATLDMMMLGLSSVFMYSLFENALPAPWNWLQDLADWAFGNEKEKSRAFFGTYPTALAPLQVITPPIARLLPPLFKGMVTGDYDRLAGYYVASMFPFGRMGWDVFGEGGLIDNPMRSVEKITGLPYMQFAREYQKEKEIIKPKGFLSLVGNAPS